MRRPNARHQPPDPDPSFKMDSSSNIRSRPRAARSSPIPQGGKRRCLLVAAAATAALLYLSVISKRSDSLQFSIIIDAGSTGTRTHVFGYRDGRGEAPEIDRRMMASMKVSPGLSSYVEDFRGAGESLVELLEFGKRKVPEEQWVDTEVRLLATAGLRLLEGEVVKGILESCRLVLRSSAFRFQDDWAAVISGADEGIYAWVTANYALDTLGGDPQDTTGIFELGGASAQVTFVSSEPLPPEFSHEIKFGKTTYHLYSHSFLHLGQNVAYESLREMLISGSLQTSEGSFQEGILRDPCTPRGYLHPAEVMKPSVGSLNLKSEYSPVGNPIGNFSACRSAALMLLQKGKDKCLYSYCHLGSAFIPKLQGRFLATENFFHTSKFFGIAPTSFLYNLMLAGEQFCGEDWSMLQKKYHALDEQDLVRYCFSSAYIVALLHDSLGVAVDDTRVEFAHQVGDIPLDWALGAFIMQKTCNQSFELSNSFAAITSRDSSALLFVFVMCIMLIFVVWSMSKWTKTQLKTIYDLEKGRYITMRINR